MVPMLTCGLLRSNFAFATAGPPQDCCRPSIRLIAWRYGWIWTGPTARTRRRRGCLPHRLRLGPERGSGGWPAGEVALTRRPATSLAGGHRARLVGSGDLRYESAGASSGPHSPVAFAMISLATLAGTSA